MTDRTQPDSASTTGSTHIIRYALELGLLWVDGDGRDKVREALDALDTLEAQLEAIGAGGVSGPLMGIAAPPTAQAEGWRPIETAPKEGVFLVFMPDEVRPARRMQVANWHPNVKIVGGLFAFDCAKVTHWMPLPPPPTSAEGVEHG